MAHVSSSHVYEHIDYRRPLGIRVLEIPDMTDLFQLNKQIEEIRESAKSARQCASKALDASTKATAVAEASASLITRATNSMASLDQGIVQHDQAISELRNAFVGHTTKIKELEEAASSMNIQDLTERLDQLQEMLTSSRRQIEEEAEMSYVKEEAKSVQSTSTPAVGDIAKVVGSALLEGATLGLASQFIAEATEIMIKKALASGMISDALAESTIFREGLKMAIPMMLLAAAQYPMMPKRDFVGKVAAIAVKGQTAQHSAMVMAFGMSMVGDMLALPSAKNLEAQLSAAQ